MLPSGAGAGAQMLSFLALALSPVLAAAHGGHETSSAATDVTMGMDMDSSQDVKSPESTEYPPTYFAHAEFSGLLYAHIAIMVAAWVFVLPVAVMLSIARSRYTLLTQLLFLATNAVGVLLITIYNAETPDLYPHNAHHTIGWIITFATSAHVLISLVRKVAGAVAGHRHSTLSSGEHRSFLPVSQNDPYSEDPYRHSGDTLQGHHTSSESHRSSSSVSTLNDEEGFALENARSKEEEQEEEDGYDERNGHDDHFDELPLSSASAAPSQGKWTVNAIKLVTSRAWKYVDIAYQIVDRIILPFGFVAIATGIITFARFFESREIFGGLAHWIKGGVFFWLGLFTLGRWAGSFGELGWAWNVRPSKQGKWRPSAEFVESFLIFFYGATNIFLEHLGGWGGDWSAQDLEHISITVLFIGGGLCGMLVESTRVRDLLNMTVTDIQPEHHLTDEERDERLPPATYEFSVNPIPALVILLLGIMMGSHQQSTMISSMVHKQWGNLLAGASFARGFSYVIMYLKPPKSTMPSRPPTELLASFGLISGGIIFMASAADCIKGMIHYELDAMFVYTVTLGFTGLLMAWELMVLAIKGWATRREQRSKFR